MGKKILSITLDLSLVKQLNLLAQEYHISISALVSMLLSKSLSGSNNESK